MSVTIQSPFNSEVLSSFDYSVSPPPTPIAKRARHFFPSNAPTPTPMFFPKSQSLLVSSFQHSSHKDITDVERKHLALLASRPSPSVQLKPRHALTDASHRTNRVSSCNGSKDVKKRFKLEEMPQLPFSFPPEKSFKPIMSPTIPDLPSLPLSSGSSKGLSKSDSALEKKTSSPAAAAQQVKLPSFQRRGVDHRTIKKRNSLVARSA